MTIGSRLFDMPEFLLDAWSAPPIVRHGVVGIARGPKGTVKAVALEMDSPGHVGDTEIADTARIVLDSDSDDLDKI
jgi:hypothetical protein